MVEAVEHALELLLVDALSRVGDREAQPAAAVGQRHGYLSAVSSVFQGVGEQVVHHLVKVVMVDVGCQAAAVGGERELYSALLCLKVVVVNDVAYELSHVRQCVVQLHLALLYAAYAQYLVYELEHAVGVALHAAQRAVGLLVVVVAHERVERTLDKRERRAQLVGHVDEEAYLRLVVVGLLLAPVGCERQGDDGQRGHCI